MTRDEFYALYDRFAKPMIDEVCANNAFVVAKDYETAKNAVYDEYQKIRAQYREAIFNRDEHALLDRHKIAACACGAIIKVSVIDKTILIKCVQEERTRLESYFYYVNEFIAFVFATKVLMAFMMEDYKEDEDVQRIIYTEFPIMPQSKNSKVSVLYSILFNLSQVNDKAQIGCEHYDMYAYAMLFFFLEDIFFRGMR